MENVAGILSRRQFVQNKKLLEMLWKFLVNFGITKNHLTFGTSFAREIFSCDLIQKKVIGTLFDTVGVVEWSYGKFGNLW